jgi:hypothetical protein
MSDATIADTLDSLTSEAQTLRAELADTRIELVNQTREARRQTITTRIAIGLVFVLLACTIAAAFQVSLDNTRQIAANNRKFCPIVSSFAPQPGDPAPAGNAAQVARAERIRDNFTQLVKVFNC